MALSTPRTVVIDSYIVALGWQVFVFAVLAGLCLGSFLNVVAHRLPRMLERQWRDEAMMVLGIEPPARRRFNLAVPRSHCPHCGARVAVLDNVPLLGWLLLRGRCRACAARIPWRYPAVEAACAALASAVLATWGVSALAACHYLFLLLLLALALIDFDALLLPDQITLPLLWLGLGAAAVVPGTPDVGEAVIGAAVGYGVLWLFYWGHRLLTRKEGMGHGDFKLLAAIGAWLGLRALLPVILIAATLGIAYAVVEFARGAAHRLTPIPFGTFLCVAGGVMLFFHEHLATLSGEDRAP